jgi:hypothetical protein
MNRIVLYLGLAASISSGINAVHTDISIIYELKSLHKKQLWELYQQSWWGKERTNKDIDIIVENSFSIGLVNDETRKLIGYARIISDCFKYAFIFDVLLDESYRGKGLGKLLMKTALNHPALKRVTVFELHCLPDMVSFYKKFGFKEDFENLKVLRLKK